MKNLSIRIFFIAVFLAATLYGCGPLTSTTVTLNREIYSSQIKRRSLLPSRASASFWEALPINHPTRRI